MRIAPGDLAESRTMHHLMMNLPVAGTLGIAALLAGPLARLPIDLGAWMLDLWFERESASEATTPARGGKQ
jgi:hypothetical protein